MSDVRGVIPVVDGEELLRSRKPFTLAVVADDMLREKRIDSAEGFDLKKILECFCKLLATSEDMSHSTWHQIFDGENQVYRDAIKWSKLKDFYWEDGVSDEEAGIVDRTMMVFEACLDEGYQTILSALFVKIVEAMGIECENDVRQRGSFWINSKYLVWGQPLSLSEKMHSCQMFPKALYGEETLEDESLYWSRNCENYDVEMLLGPYNECDVQREIQLYEDNTSAAVLAKDILELRACTQRLIFLDLYLRKNLEMVKERTEKLQRKFDACERSYLQVVQKEAAEDVVMQAFGGSRLVANRKIAAMVKAMMEFREDKNESKLTMQAKDILGLKYFEDAGKATSSKKTPIKAPSRMDMDVDAPDDSSDLKDPEYDPTQPWLGLPQARSLARNTNEQEGGQDALSLDLGDDINQDIENEILSMMCMTPVNAAGKRKGVRDVPVVVTPTATTTTESMELDPVTPTSQNAKQIDGSGKGKGTGDITPTATTVESKELDATTPKNENLKRVDVSVSVGDSGTIDPSSKSVQHVDGSAAETGNSDPTSASVQKRKRADGSGSPARSTKKEKRPSEGGDSERRESRSSKGRRSSGERQTDRRSDKGRRSNQGQRSSDRHRSKERRRSRGHRRRSEDRSRSDGRPSLGNESRRKSGGTDDRKKKVDANDSHQKRNQPKSRRRRSRSYSSSSSTGSSSGSESSSSYTSCEGPLKKTKKKPAAST